MELHIAITKVKNLKRSGFKTFCYLHVNFLGSKYSITCGEHLLNADEDGQVTFEVTEVIPHPKYHGADKGYDIAIFKINHEKADIIGTVNSNGNTQMYPACLPRTSEEYSTRNDKVWVAGWGLRKQRRLSDVKKIIEDNLCR